MKALVCEMCGSNDVVKQDGLYVCQNCGTRYSVEEARKIMIKGTLDVEGTIRIDDSSELNNLYEIARRAKKSDNIENALKYYSMILVKDPNSWEANFYESYFKARSCRIMDIDNAAISFSKCLQPVFEIVRENVPEEKLTQIINELYEKSTEIANILFINAKKHFENIDIQIQGKYTKEYNDRILSAKQILYNFGDSLENVFGEKYSSVAVNAWKEGIKLHYTCANISLGVNKQTAKHNKEIITFYANKIKKRDPNYKAPEILTEYDNTGCYIFLIIIAIIFAMIYYFSN